MTTDLSPRRARWATPRRARWATLLTFALAGLLCAGWTARLPALKEKLALTDGQLGIEVLGWGVGGLAVMLFAGRLIERFGSKAVLRIAVVGSIASLALIGLAPTFALLICAGAIFGVCFGLVDLAMNSQGSLVERAAGRPLMAGLHSGWSVGAVVGALVGAVLAYVGIGFTASMLLLAAAALPVAIAIGNSYLDDRSDACPISPSVDLARTPTVERVPRVVWLIGSIAFCTFLIEGAVADWGGVYLHDALGASQAVAALAYACFEAAMALGRMFADRFTERFSARALIALCSAAAGLSLGVVVAAPSPQIALFGFALVGASVCVIAPRVVSLAGAANPSRAARAIARTTAMGYSGILLGPVIIGTVAQVATLRVALGFGVVVALGSAVLAWRLPPIAGPGDQPPRPPVDRRIRHKLRTTLVSRPRSARPDPIGARSQMSKPTSTKPTSTKPTSTKPTSTKPTSTKPTSATPRPAGRSFAGRIGNAWTDVRHGQLRFFELNRTGRDHRSGRRPHRTPVA